MPKFVTGSRPCEVVVQPALATIQIPLPLASVLADAKQGLLDLVVSTGLQVFEAMLEQDREALCGPKWKRVPERSAGRAGHTRGEVTLGGRRIVLQRPRVRSKTEGELTLPSFAAAKERDPLDARTLEAIALGVSNRDYRRSLEAVPASLDERSVSRSAVSRRFVALSVQQLAEWMSQPLGDLDLRVVQIDGSHFHEHVVRIALGVDGLRPEACSRTSGGDDGELHGRACLALGPGRSRALAGSAAAVRDRWREGAAHGDHGGFGSAAIVQRCQVHKRRNVLEHLPERMRPSVRKAMQQAYDMADSALAHRQLERLAKSLERAHPGAAATLARGTRRDTDSAAARHHGRALPDAAQHEPDREPEQLARPLHAQRQALARRQHDRALDRRRPPRGQAQIPSHPRPSRPEDPPLCARASRRRQDTRPREARRVGCSPKEPPLTQDQQRTGHPRDSASRLPAGGCSGQPEEGRPS